MSAADDFLRAIRANPDDDAPRLIFADWLDENEQPERAEYIRQQIQLAQLHPHDPDRFALATHSERLWNRYRQAWSKPLPSIVQQIYPARGFLSSVQIVGENLDQLPEVLAHHPIGKLTVEDNSYLRSDTISDDRRRMYIELLRSMPDLAQIRQFDFSSSHRGAGPNILYELADRLPNLSHLQFIAASEESVGGNNQNLVQRLANHPITTINLPNAGGDWMLTRLANVNLRHLRSLRLQRGNFTMTGIRNLLAAPWIQQLETLQLSSCGLRSDTLMALVDQPWPNLHTLDLSLNWLNRTTTTKLLTSTNFPALRHLDLGDSDLYDDDIAAIANLPLLNQLYTLNLRRNDIRVRGATAIAESEQWVNLWCLNLQDNHLGDDGLRALLHTKRFPKLTVLNIRRNQLKSDGLFALVNSNLLPQLRALEMNIEASSHAWPYLFANGQSLEMLDLNESELSDEMLRAMLNVSPLPPLLGLGLDSTPITDHGLHTLTQSPLAYQLGELRLMSSIITPDGWEMIGRSPMAKHLCSLLSNQFGVSSLHAVMGDRVS